MHWVPEGSWRGAILQPSCGRGSRVSPASTPSTAPGEPSHSTRESGDDVEDPHPPGRPSTDQTCPAFQLGHVHRGHTQQSRQSLPCPLQFLSYRLQLRSRHGTPPVCPASSMAGLPTGWMWRRMTACSELLSQEQTPACPAWGGQLFLEGSAGGGAPQ